MAAVTGLNHIESRVDGRTLTPVDGPVDPGTFGTYGYSGAFTLRPGEHCFTVTATELPSLPVTVFLANTRP